MVSRKIKKQPYIDMQAVAYIFYPGRYNLFCDTGLQAASKIRKETSMTKIMVSNFKFWETNFTRRAHALHKKGNNTLRIVSPQLGKNYFNLRESLSLFGFQKNPCTDDVGNFL